MSRSLVKISLTISDILAIALRGTCCPSPSSHPDTDSPQQRFLPSCFKCSYKLFLVLWKGASAKNMIASCYCIKPKLAGSQINNGFLHFTLKYFMNEGKASKLMHKKNSGYTGFLFIDNLLDHRFFLANSFSSVLSLFISC